jgi:hypothetical protein
MVENIAVAARAREAQECAAAGAALGAESAPLVVAHLGFAVLHLAMAVAADGLARAGYAAEVRRSGFDVTLRANGRRATAVHLLTARDIEIRLFGPGGCPADWQQSHIPPLTFGLPELLAWATPIVERMARFLTRSDGT